MEDRVNCWFCEQDTNLLVTHYGEYNCPHCGVILSIYNPTDFVPLTEPPTEEEAMDLKNWSKENAKFIKIKSGESYEGIYKGSKPGVNMNGEPAVVYDIDGKDFKSSSTVLAGLFSEIPEGTKVKIIRAGDGLQTKWTVEKI